MRASRVVVATMACGRWSLKVRRFESERLRMELVKILGAWARKLVTIARGFRTLNAKTPEPYPVAKCGLLVRSETSQSLKLLSCSQLFQETKSPRRRSCEGFCGRDFGSGHSLSGLDNMLSCACLFCHKQLRKSHDSRTTQLASTLNVSRRTCSSTEACCSPFREDGCFD